MRKQAFAWFTLESFVMPTKTTYPLQIFYDGSCPLCAAKMELYRGKEHGGRLEFVDVSAPAFDPAPYGIPLAAFMYELHAIDGSGNVFRGVDAFRAIWQALPPSSWYGLLGILVSLPLVHFIAGLVYRLVAGTRRYLPANRDACSDGSCRIGRGGPSP